MPKQMLISSRSTLQQRDNPLSILSSGWSVVNWRRNTKSMSCRLAQSTFLSLGPQKRQIEGCRTFPQSSTSSGACLLKWEGLPQRRSKQKQCLLSFKRLNIVKVVSVSIAPSLSDNAADRQ